MKKKRKKVITLSDRLIMALDRAPGCSQLCYADHEVQARIAAALEDIHHFLRGNATRAVPPPPSALVMPSRPWYLKLLKAWRGE